MRATVQGQKFLPIELKQHGQHRTLGPSERLRLEAIGSQQLFEGAQYRGVVIQNANWFDGSGH